MFLCYNEMYELFVFYFQGGIELKKLLTFCLVLLFAVTAVLPAVGADEAKRKTLGDVNGDGKITANDALLAL